MKNRFDIWSEKDDNILAQTVLRYIKTGSTQIKAFDETAAVLKRSSAACSFRWNAGLRKQYEKEIRQAKAQRLQAKRHPVILADAPENRDAAPRALFKQIEAYLSDFNAVAEEVQRLRKQVCDLKAENEMLRVGSADSPVDLKAQLDADYRAWITIMNRARRQFENIVESERKHTFLMDQNGNIERVL